MPYVNLTVTPNNISNQSSVQKTQFYKGFSTANDASFSTKIYDFELIKQDIMNMLLTKKGERVMNPEFGTIIWELIYEPFTADVKQQISNDVTRIMNYDPRVTPTRIDITEAEYGMVIDVTLYYVTANMSESMKVSFDKELGIASLI